MPRGAVPKGSLVLVLGLLASLSVAQQPDLAGLPEPLLENLEGPVRSQLEGARREVVDAVGEGRVAEAVAALGRLCQLYLRYELFEPASPCLGQIRSLEPTRHRWPYYQVLLYERQGDVGKARAAAARALELRPEDGATLMRAAGLALRDGDIEWAKETYRSLASRPGWSGPASFGLARAAAEAGDHAAAIPLFEEALASQPDGSVAHYHLGMSHRAVGDMDRAREELARSSQRAIEFVDPLRAELDRLGVSDEEVFSAGVRALADGRHEDAIRAFREVLATVPDDSEAHFNLARALIEADRTEEAATHLETAIAVDENYGAAHFNLGLLYGREGRREAAGRHLIRASEIDPENFDWRVLAARARAEAGDLDAATRDLEEVAALDPGLPSARSALGAMYSSVGANDRAAAHYTALVELAPEDPEARVGLALSLLRAGSYLEARDSLEASVQRLPDVPVLSLLLAQVLATAPEAEVRDGRRAVILARGIMDRQVSIDNAETLAMALAEAGRFEEAEQLQQRVVDEERRVTGSVSADRQRRLDTYRRRQPWRGGAW